MHITYCWKISVHLCFAWRLTSSQIALTALSVVEKKKKNKKKKKKKNKKKKKKKKKKNVILDIKTRS